MEWRQEEIGGEIFFGNEWLVLGFFCSFLFEWTLQQSQHLPALLPHLGLQKKKRDERGGEAGGGLAQL